MGEKLFAHHNRINNRRSLSSVVGNKIGDIVYSASNALYGYLQKRRNFSGSYHLIDNRKNYEKLCVIMAGYKPYIYDLFFQRIYETIPKDVDVIIVSGGMYDRKLEEIAVKREYSYLYTFTNRPGLEVNLAIDLHKSARYIFKVDEDILVSKGFFENLLLTLELLKKENKYEPGIITPLFNINNFTYLHFLEIFGLKDEYFQKFGEYKSTRTHAKVWYSPEAAIYLSEKTLPLDENAEKLSRNELKYVLAPHCVSISAFLIEKEVWQNYSGFDVGKGLGFDEIRLCQKLSGDYYGRVIAVSLNTLVMHLGYGPQNDQMKSFIESHLNELSIKTSKAS